MADTYETALANHALEDVQPRYRQLLLQLKQQDPAAYEVAVGRYRTEVEDRVEAAADPLSIWLGYGGWLAAQIEPGTLMKVAENGRAHPTEPGDVPGSMLIHLPEAANRRGFVVAMPTEPSAAQREAASLLCG